MAAAATQQASTSSNFPSISPSQQYNTATILKNNQEYNPRNVSAVLNYFKDNEDGSPPAPTYVGKPETYDRPTSPKNVTVHDIRGSEDKFSLDTTGFAVVQHKSEEKDFADDENIKRVYYPEIESILEEATGANRIFIFDHTIRRAQADDRTSSAPLRGPVQRVHIDQSYRAVPNRVRHHLPEEAEKLLQGRYQIINVWRPIKTILKDPLAIAESNSVSDDDLVPIGLIYPDRAGETYSVRASEGHKWHYLNQQTPEEVVLIKCFDSKVDGRARRVPHTAFVDEERENEAPRESIEVRALIFGDS